MKQNDKLTDETLRRTLQSNLPKTMPSPWFTKTVLNRLPEKRRVAAAAIEFCVYVCGLIISIALCYGYIDRMMHGSVITVGNLMSVAVCGSIIIGLLYMIISPLVNANSIR